MTTHRRYTFTLCVEAGHSEVSQRLNLACERHWWFTDPVVRGNGLGVLQIQFEVAARDQWWAHRRANNLIEDITYSLGVEVPVPEWENLAPHTNRGRYNMR